MREAAGERSSVIIKEVMVELVDEECIPDSDREEVGGVDNKEWDAKGGSEVGAPSTEVVKDEIVETVGKRVARGL
ncbi:hypothetical protein COCNU_01G018480 [Cocos nucifera]|uniref:Uncharacterized protein n=1 Tax=Cocos nucifera TaxID=13894 RepID=A0A8K0HWM0_COCNU|nr:hypothetical protein COCNU_01G018480 [Cocos nucifera]